MSEQARIFKVQKSKDRFGNCHYASSIPRQIGDELLSETDFVQVTKSDDGYIILQPVILTPKDADVQTSNEAKQK